MVKCDVCDVSNNREKSRKQEGHSLGRIPSERIKNSLLTNKKKLLGFASYYGRTL